MLFNSVPFLIFLPIVFAGYWFVFRKLRWQNAFIVAASLFFYGWWDWRFLSLILLTTISCFLAGRSIDNSADDRKRRWICGLNIALNIGILFTFKYFNFFNDNLRLLFSQIGYQLDWFTIEVLLPVGLSFYTFQAISYPIDVYRRNIRATNDIVAFTSFITFFPQLVAGPIERSTQLLPQFLKPRSFSYPMALDGMRQMLWGFFKKMVVADNCAFLAGKIFEDYSECGGWTLWLGGIFFAFQIYGDFSGYSDIAIGVAKLFGITLSRNFHYPYFSRSISEFWRRWHISLNTWFRDYVYIPLGGSRCSRAKTIRNILIVFLLSGLWHGADWTFVAWGLYFALLFIPGVIRGRRRDDREIVARDRRFPSLKEVWQMFSTFFLATVGWIIFRAENITDAFRYLSGCFTRLGEPGKNVFYLFEKVPVYTAMMIVFMLAVEWMARRKSFGLQIVEGRSLVVRRFTYLLVLALILFFTGQQADFVYFQF